MVLLSASNCASSEDEAGWPSLPPIGASSPVAEAGAKPLLLPDGGRGGGGGGDSLMPPTAVSLSSWRGTLAETAAAAASNEVEDGDEDEEEEDRCAAAAAAILKISQSRSETNLEKEKERKKYGWDCGFSCGRVSYMFRVGTSASSRLAVRHSKSNPRKKGWD